MIDVLALLLAGGRGSRLEPLTRERAKPAVPFGGVYRIVDFTLSNCINSGLRRIFVLTQYKASSLDRHISMAWNIFSRELGEFIEVLPPQQRLSENWYQGTLDAIYQNIYTIERTDPRLVLILSGDHIYKMDYGEMIRSHQDNMADLTVGCIPAPLAESVHFGAMDVDEENRIRNFSEKPAKACPIPGDPNHFLASMGIYVISARLMYEMLCQDATRNDSKHDFGTDLIPHMIKTHRVFAFPFRDRNRKDIPYWRDVGTLDSYYKANMDLVEIDPVLNLYDREWPIRTYQPQLPPPKFIFEEQAMNRRGEAHNSLVSQGCIISGGHVRKSILSPNVRVNSYSLVENSILFEGVEVGRHCRLRNAIVDKYVKIPPNTIIGYDLEKDLQRGFKMSPNGIIVIPKAESPESF